MFLEKNQKQFLFPNVCFVCAQTGQHLGKHASARMFLQQCFLVCGGLHVYTNTFGMKRLLSDLGGFKRNINDGKNGAQKLMSGFKDVRTIF